MSKSITDLLDAVTKAKAALDKAQTEYDAAKAELASSPLLAEAGLQVIGGAEKKNLTIEQAVLKALAGGKELSVTEIANKANELKGRIIPRHNITWTLAKLKKDKVITNPDHGHYKIK
ncbi:MAG TPA: hypothetical protein VFZ59_10305 [Verrucomicrobiae bacterium]|nr:hypothetical protein [Verrucomicrobiae bacterium]